MRTVFRPLTRAAGCGGTLTFRGAQDLRRDHGDSRSLVGAVLDQPAFKSGLGYDSGSTRGIGFGETSALLTEM
jgi:hypothetical protein